MTMIGRNWAAAIGLMLMTADKGVLDKLFGEPEMTERGPETNSPTKNGYDAGNQGVQK